MLKPNRYSAKEVISEDKSINIDYIKKFMRNSSPDKNRFQEAIPSSAQSQNFKTMK